MQAVGVDGASATLLGRRLGVTKQAAGKTIERLEQLGYVERLPDPGDARSKRVVLTERGHEVLRISAEIFGEIRNEWAATMGVDRLRELEHGLYSVASDDEMGLDAQAWFGG